MGRTIVVYHHGDVPTGGHYTCHVNLGRPQQSAPEQDATEEDDDNKKEESIWVEMDDTVLERSTLSQVLSPKKDRQAYMLFYIRHGDASE